MKSNLLGPLFGLLVGCFATLVWQEGPVYSEKKILEKDSTGRLLTCRLVPLLWPTTEELAALRREPDQIVTLFTRYHCQLRQALGPEFESLGNRELRYIFCALTAHALAPSGPSTETRWPELLRARTLNCGNYGLLTVYLAGCFGKKNTLPVHFVGWEGPTAGNHQMLFAEQPEQGIHLLLDPTVALVGLVDFDTVASGRPVAANRLVSFCYRTDEEIDAFRVKLIDRLRRGQFRPSELLYYFEDLDGFLQHYGDPCWWPTPASRRWRKTHVVPAPAASLELAQQKATAP